MVLILQLKRTSVNGDSYTICLQDVRDCDMWWSAGHGSDMAASNHLIAGKTRSTDYNSSGFVRFDVCGAETSQ